MTDRHSDSVRNSDPLAEPDTDTKAAAGVLADEAGADEEVLGLTGDTDGADSDEASEGRSSSAREGGSGGGALGSVLTDGFFDFDGPGRSDSGVHTTDFRFTLNTAIEALQANRAPQAPAAKTSGSADAATNTPPDTMAIWQGGGGTSESSAAAASGPSPDFVPTDPLFSQQLHLRNTNAGQFDIRVEDVWDDYTGNGINITVIDTRVDRFHADYNANYDISFDWDYVDNDTAPDATGSENHGTAVIGIIAAEQGNSIGGVGVAWDSTVRSFGGLSFEYLDEQLEDAAGLGDGVGNIHGNANGSDIVSMSFGVNIDLSSNQLFNNDMSASYLPDVQATEARMADAALNGRGGLGTIYVKSAGNSRAAANSELREETTADHMDTSKYTIVVGATRWDGWVDNTSSPGASLLVSAPTDNLSSASSVTTTDRTGADGYNGTDYTSTFGGTSAAAPQVAGVVALMLQANPNLGWRDVQKILAYSARHVGSAVGATANTGAPSGFGDEQGTQGFFGGGATWFWNDASDWNGGGLHFSNDYGYGLVDAKAAVRLAESWRDQSTSANDVQASQDVDGTNVTTTYSSSFTTFNTTETTDILIEHVYLNVNIVTLDDMNDMEIFVTSPGGTRVQMIADTGGNQAFSGDGWSSSASVSDWSFGTTAFMGETSAGTWTVQIRDDDGSVAGTFTTDDIDLFFYGGTVDDDDLFIVTNEFSDYDGVAGHSTDFAGGTGVNVLNAAAVDSNTTIDLFLNNGTIDGVSITNSNINIVYTGDGDDTIIGDVLEREIYSGRGDDFVQVRAPITNTKIFDGGTGTDTISWQGNSETGVIFDMAAGTATDTSLNVATFVGFEHLTGTNNADSIIGTSDANSILGGDGDDTINGGEGLDVIYGGAGTDTIDYSSFTFGGFFTTTINLTTGRWTTFLSTEIIEQFENVEGSQGAENIIGTSGANVINGNNGADTIRGSGGADVINAGAGNDTVVWQTLSNGASMNGGTGTDTIDGDGVNFGPNAVFNLAAGTYDSGTGFLMDWVSFENYDNAGSASGDEEVVGSASSNTISTGGGENSISGSFGVDHLYSGGGNDTLEGGFSTDFVYGGDGDDLFIVRDGEFIDHTYGGAGIDTFDASDESGTGTAIQIDLAAGTITGYGLVGGDFLSIENVIGTGLGDEICGDANDNTISGGAGDDTLCGEGGNDLLYGGDDNDILYGGNDDDVNYGDDGDDTIYGDGGVDTNYGGAGNDTIVKGSEGLLFEHHDGGTGTDTIDYSATFLAAMKYDLAAGLVSFNTASPNNDTVVDFENVLTGHSDSEVIGTSGANIIISQEGDDSIDGGGGGDSIFSGAGNDYVRLEQSNTINLGSGDDEVQLISGGIESVDGGAGNDTIVSTQFWSDTTVWDLDAGTRTVGAFTGTWLNFEHYTNTVGFDRSSVFGTNGDNTITITGGGNNSILGRGGNDIIDAGAGNDEIDDGSGADVVYAGSGDDTVYWTSGSADYVDGGTGNDTINGNGISFGTLARFDLANDMYTVVGGSFTEDWIGFEHYDNSSSASGSEQVIGTTGNNWISTGGGNNSVSALAGTDTLYGGGGDDQLYGGAGQDLVYGGTGDDWLEGNNESDTVFGGAGNDTLIGGGNDDELYGEAGNDSMVGDTGDDLMDGGAGNDNLDGEGGNDLMYGGAGDDILSGGSRNDSIFDGTGSDIIYGGDGNDFIDVQNSSGVNQADTAYGDDGDDTIRRGLGGTGEDAYYGGAGNDLIDTSFQFFNSVVHFDLSNNEMTNFGSFFETWDGFEHFFNNTSGSSEQVTGTSGDNTITTGGGGNSISGLGGNDLIYSGDGDDLIDPGTGQDSVYAGNGNDTIDDNQGITPSDVDHYDGGAGVDTLDLNLNWNGTVVINLATGQQENTSGVLIGDTYANFENVIVGGAAGVIGNSADNVITATKMTAGLNANMLDGGAGNDTITANAGNDTLIGGTGDDILYGGTGNDTLDGGDGHDLIYGGDGDDSIDPGQSSAFDDTVYAGAGDDRVLRGIGQAFEDFYYGGTGNDTIVTDGIVSGTAVFNLQTGFLTAGGGNFEVWNSFEHYDGSAGSGDEGVVGSSGTNTIVMGSGDNSVNAGGGADFVNAGAGNDHVYDTDGTTSDSYDGGAGDDALDYSGILFVPGVIFDGAAGTVGNSPATWDTFTNFETLIASRGNDILYGGGSVVVLDGDEGRDYVRGSAATAESLIGGIGNDTLIGISNNSSLLDALYGGGGDDIHIISGGNFAAHHFGGAGTDTLDVSGFIISGYRIDLELAETEEVTGVGPTTTIKEIENVIGTDFGDLIRGDFANNTIEGRDGGDTLFGNDGHDVIYGGDGNDTIEPGESSSFDDTIYAGAGDDRVLRGLGQAFEDYYYGGTGNDTIVTDGILVGTAVFNLATGFLVNGGNFEVWDSFEHYDGTAGSGDEGVLGSSGSNTILMGAGDNSVDAGGGTDTVHGGAGNDSVYDADGTTFDSYDGGTGKDTLDYSRILFVPGVVFDAVAGTVGKPAANNDTFTNFETIVASQGHDIVYGGAATEMLDGHDGNDFVGGGALGEIIFGGLGNDTVNGGLGADTLYGGGGLDILDYTGSSAGVHVWYDGSTVTGGDATGDTFFEIEVLRGSGLTDTLVGDGNDSTLDGADGADFVYGGAGHDVLYGGDGNDTIEPGESSDFDDTVYGGGGDDRVLRGLGQAFEDAYYGGTGNDTIVTDGILVGTARFNLATGFLETGGGNFEIWDSFEHYDGSLGFGNEAVLGSGGDNVIRMGAGANSVDGGAGDDLIYGGGGADFLISASGSNTIHGDGGTDSIIGGTDGDLIYGGSESDSLNGALGDDTLYAGVGSDLVFGSFGADVLFGEGGVDTLHGESDADTLYGGLADDVLYGGDQDDVLNGGVGGDLLYGGAGIDTADYSGSSAAVTVALGAAFASGGHATGDQFFDIENLTGSSFADVLFGDSGANTIDGGAGGDVLSGEGGSDVIYGGVGFDALSGVDGGAGVADTLFGGANLDIAYYFTASSGQEVDFSDRTDLSKNSGEHTLDTWDSIEGFYGANNFSNTITGDGQDNLFLGGNQADTLYGGGGSDVLTASGGADVIYGGDDADFIAGDAGDDAIFGGAGPDTFYVFATSGIDRIKDYVETDDSFLFYQTGATQWSDLTFNVSGNDVHITRSGSSFTVIVENATLADLDNSGGNFLFL